MVASVLGDDRDKVTVYCNDYSGDGGPSILKDLSVVLFDPDGEDQTTRRTPNVFLVTFYAMLGGVEPSSSGTPMKM